MAKNAVANRPVKTLQRNTEMSGGKGNAGLTAKTLVTNESMCLGAQHPTDA